MKIGKNSVVTLCYQVTTPDGTLVDKGTERIRYLHGGYDDIFEKLEQALDGKDVGESIRVVLEPKDSFGEYDAALVAVESPDSFETIPEVGRQFERDMDGEPVLFTVTEVAEDKVVVDGNHPLAGMTLVFSATIEDVRPATKGEIKAKADPNPEPAPKAKETPLLSHGPWFLVLRYKIYSQAHKLCWQAPMFLLPAIAALLYWLGSETACFTMAAIWLGWSFLGALIIAKAIDVWGFKFLFFDFSPNLDPTPLERRIVNIGQMGPVLIGLLFIVAMVVMDGFGEFLTKLGVGFAIAFALIIPGGFIVPFLVMVLTGFKVRPVVDERG